VRGIGRSSTDASQAASLAVALLDTLDQWVDSVEPIEQAMRFGNKAFAKFQTLIVEQGESVILPMLEGTP
jgi:hypothetical protein